MNTNKTGRDQGKKQSSPPDPRHLKRIELMQLLFAYSFLPKEAPATIAPIVAVLDEIDATIAEIAPERPLREIAKVDLAILRLSVFELSHSKIPKKVVINEAIELAKEFGAENSAKFINGALSQLL